ncbi:MAG: DNA N-6-adenine-methyltransferase [Cellulomonas sp.]
MARTPSCARCRTPLPPAAGTGRPRRWCSDSCRTSAYRERRRHRARRDQRAAWWTPLDLADRVRGEHDLGLDAAACQQSSLVPDSWLGPTHPDADRRDALAYRSWGRLVEPGQTVWINPPYTPVPLLRSFLEVAAQTAADGTAVVALVPASTSSAWWHDAVLGAGAEVEFLRGRLRFRGPFSTGGSAMTPSALVRYEPV